MRRAGLNRTRGICYGYAMYCKFGHQLNETAAAFT